MCHFITGIVSGRITIEEINTIGKEFELQFDTCPNSGLVDHMLFYPGLNERLYLCYKSGKNVDPLKDFVFDRNIPLDYEVYIKLYTDKMTEEEWLELSL